VTILFLSECTEVTKVYLNNNKIKSVPVEIAQLKWLELFYLNKNALTDLPAELGSLKKLQYLMVGENKIKVSPDVFIFYRMILNGRIMPWCLGASKGARRSDGPQERAALWKSRCAGCH